MAASVTVYQGVLLNHVGKELKCAIQGVAENNNPTAGVLGSCGSLFWPRASERIQWDSRASGMEETCTSVITSKLYFFFHASRFSFAISVQPTKPRFSMRGVRIYKCCRTKKNKTTSCIDGTVWIPQLYHCTPNADAISFAYTNKLH